MLTNAVSVSLFPLSALQQIDTFAEICNLPTMTTLDELPDEVFTRILHYLRDPISFCHLERTCKTFHRVLSHDDDVWRYCPNALLGEEPTHRERSIVATGKQAIGRKILKAQVEDSNQIIKVLGVTGLRALLEEAARHQAHFSFRGDSLGLIAELLQDHLTNKLERALTAAVYALQRANSDAYPVVEVEDVRFALFMDDLTAPLLPPPIVLLPFDPVSKQTIIRNIGYRAGVGKISPVAIGKLWDNLCSVIVAICQTAVHAYSEVISLDNINANGLVVWGNAGLDERSPRPIFGDVDMYNDLPPYRYVTEGDARVVDRVVVPRMVAMAASKLGLSRVYGDTWVAEEGKTIGQEKEEAILRYRTFPEAGIFVHGDSEEESEWDSDYEDKYDDDSDCDITYKSVSDNDDNSVADDDDDDTFVTDDGGAGGTRI